jgi:putative multicomponent Na+:H+ antiporter subunit B
MDNYVYPIVALLPVAAAMVVLQSNPYHALLIRGILGAIAALVYSVLGAPDVALTEALVGTLLAITLYAIAVRSSLVLRVGVLAETMNKALPFSIDTADAPTVPESSYLDTPIEDLRTIFGKYHLRVELVPYPDRVNLHQALMDKKVQAICDRSTAPEGVSSYRTTIRLPRLYEIVQAELPPASNHSIYLSTSELEEKH